MTVKLAFYKKSGNMADKFIRTWTASKYSHVELIIDGVWYTSTSRGEIGGIQKTRRNAEVGTWDFLEVQVPSISGVTKSIQYFNTQIGKKYDWKGIFLAQGFGLNLHCKDKWFCSEIDTKMLQIMGHPLLINKRPHDYSPGRLFRTFNPTSKFIKG